MDKEQEILSLRKQLGDINAKITGELGRIEAVKKKLSTAYRRADRDKYLAESAGIKENLEKYRGDQETIERRLAELERA